MTALISCLGVIIASLLNHRAVTAAPRITAADPVGFDAAPPGARGRAR